MFDKNEKCLMPIYSTNFGDNRVKEAHSTKFLTGEGNYYFPLKYDKTNIYVQTDLN